MQATAAVVAICKMLVSCLDSLRFFLPPFSPADRLTSATFSFVKQSNFVSTFAEMRSDSA